MQQHLDHVQRSRKQAAGSRSHRPVKDSGEVIYRQAGDDWF
nr:MAG TPA: hypothetical protein [Caudoviricetes sp.]